MSTLQDSGEPLEVRVHVHEIRTVEGTAYWEWEVGGVRSMYGWKPVEVAIQKGTEYAAERGWTVNA